MNSCYARFVRVCLLLCCYFHCFATCFARKLLLLPAHSFRSDRFVFVLSITILCVDVTLYFFSIFLVFGVFFFVHEPGLDL